jgi:type II secretory pathway pseudopilin PulG
MGRGFTLLEAVVALTLTSIVSAAAVGVFAQVQGFSAVGAARNQAAREVQLVLDVFSRDIAFAGVGVPRGLRLDTADFAAPREDNQLRPLVRIGQVDNIAFVGDLPFPNAEVSGVAHVVNIDPANLRAVFLTSDLSGCTPQSSAPNGYACNTLTASLLGAFTSGSSCGPGAAAQPTCPWGMNKWQAGSNGVHLAFGTTDGGWYEREWDLTTTAELGSLMGIEVADKSPDGAAFVVGGGDLPRAQFVAPIGAGWVSHVDRVFWSLEATAAGSPCVETNPPSCVLRRRQCWGQIVDPGAALWPPVGDSTLRSNQNPLHCTAPSDGTPWEPVATGVTSMTVRYFNGAGGALLAPWTPEKSAAVKVVEVEIAIGKKVKGSSDVGRHRGGKRFYIENRGGIRADPAIAPALGGCGGGGDEGGCGDDG